MGKPKQLLEILVKPFTGRRDREGKEERDLQAIAAKEQKVFRYETLVGATGNFKHKLGQGGFGPVFKGRLSDGREVAVKQLGTGSRQGAKEFQNEAVLLSRVQHNNVVNLYGYCAYGDEKLLVYEFVPNQSLDKFLFSQDGNLKQTQLDWNRRFEVIVGIARGLLYLHEDAHVPIIHRDIKASNVLLDDKWVPKIADFGMARLFPEDQTHVNTRVAGTSGYMAPEYVMRGILSAKADVFSFGVLVLELVAGRKNSSFTMFPDSEVDSLLEWAWKLYKKGQTLDMLDPALESTVDPEQASMCVKIGLLCTQADPKLRPDMNRVVVILSKKPTTLDEPTLPRIPGSSYRHPTRSTRGSNQNSTSDSSYSINSASTATTVATNNTVTTSTTTMINPRFPPHELLQSNHRDSGSITSKSGIASTSHTPVTRRSSKQPILYQENCRIHYNAV